MPWVRLDDGFTEHPKILVLSDAAFRLHLHALCYSARALTDGHLSNAWLTGGKGRSTPKAVAQLVAVGVWREAPTGGYQIHDYLKYQPSRSEIEKSRAAAADRMKRAREVRANNSRTSREVRNEGVRSTPSRPDPTRRTRDRAEPEGFAEFWKAYPRKVGRPKALEAWKKADLPEPSVLLSAVAGQARNPDWHKENGRFIPHPATWLNQRRWEDHLDLAALPDAGEERTRQHLAKLDSWQK